MAQTGYTPIVLYASGTTGNTPSAGNLANGELAINYFDGKLFYKDASGVVQVIAGKGGAGVAGGSNTQVQYNSSGSLAGSANMTFNGTTLTLANDASISGLTVGKGATSGGGTNGSSTALGIEALNSNTTGYLNTGVGYRSLYTNTEGINNSGFGYLSLYLNTTGSANTGVGQEALRSNTTASNNTALGYQAGYSNTAAQNNTLIGHQAGYSQTTGSGENTCIGRAAGYTSTGAYNTFVGAYSGYYVTTGTNNTFVGPSGTYASGLNMTTGSKNSIFGAFTGNQGGLDIRTASNYIVLSDGDGNPRAWWDSSGYMRSVGVYNQAAAGSANVIVDSSGNIYRSTSALKYKTDIRDLESIDINKFRPVRYKSNCAIDDPTLDHFGVIADEVDQAGIKELVSYGANGEVEGFQYERLTVVLLKELQTLRAEIDSLKKQLEAK